MQRIQYKSPSTSSTPPPAGCNDYPSTSFGQSDFSSSSLVTMIYIPFGESAVETLSPIHTFTTDQIEKFQKHVDNGLLKKTLLHGYGCIVPIICLVILCMMKNITNEAANQ